jgi:HPt (histidine-containing phosphotransfer) domain-containing protein
MRQRKEGFMGNLPAGFSERLNKLKQSFIDSVPERLSYIDSALEVITREASSLAELEEALKPLQAKVHDLAGAAGTFGFKKLGQLAYKAEIACGDLLASNDMPSFAERQMMGGLLVAIREAGSCCLMHGASTQRFKK